MIRLIADTLTPVFFVLGLGYVAGWRKLVDNRKVAQLNTFVMQFALPASLLAAVGSTPSAQLRGEGSILVIFLVLMLASYGVWYAWARRGARTGVPEAAVQSLTFAFPNMAAVALPVLSSLIGTKGAVHVAVVLTVGAAVPTSITVFLLSISAETGGRGTSRAKVVFALRTALLKPVVVAPLVGAALSMSGLGLAPVAAGALKLIGQAAMGGALFLTGLILSAQAFRLSPAVIAATLGSNVLRPVAAYGLARLLAAPPDIVGAAVVLAASPAGFFGLLFGTAAGAPVREASSMILASTVASALTLAAAIALTFSGAHS